MTKLDCNVVNCAYNDDNCCRKDNIQIEGQRAMVCSETCCGSFEQRGCGCATNRALCTCKDTDVCCDAVQCKFNGSGHCKAGHIGVCGSHADRVRETECGSFRLA